MNKEETQKLFNKHKTIEGFHEVNTSSKNKTDQGQGGKSQAKRAGYVLGRCVCVPDSLSWRMWGLRAPVSHLSPLGKTQSKEQGGCSGWPLGTGCRRPAWTYQPSPDVAPTCVVEAASHAVHRPSLSTSPAAPVASEHTSAQVFGVPKLRFPLCEPVLC